MVKFLLTFFCILFLSGCGFKPYSASILPQQLKKLYYQTDNPYETFTRYCRQKLKASGVELLDNPQSSVPILSIITNYTHKTNNPSSTTQARIYDLSYQATITVSNLAGKLLLPIQTVHITRSITLQPNEIFAATPQVQFIQQEMHQELYTKIFNILSSPMAYQALQNFPHKIKKANSG